MISSIEEDSQDKQNVNNDFDETFVEEEPFPSSSAYDQYTDNLSQVTNLNKNNNKTFIKRSLYYQVGYLRAFEKTQAF